MTTVGTAMLVYSALLVTNFRGFLTWYARRCWHWYQKPFLGAFARDFYADEDHVRRTFRRLSVLGLGMGVFFLFVEITALVTGHVA